MSHEAILVTGAAGSVGSTARTAITILLEQGHRVRAMVHTLDARADTLRAMGAEVVVADMLDLIAVRGAMHGCSVVYFTISISPNYLEAATNVAVTAQSLGVKAFVNLSQMTLSQMSETETTGSPEQKQEWLAEQVLRWSGLPVVYLRPTVFFDGLFIVQGAKGIREDDAIRLPFADGKTSPIAAADVGAAAAAVLANPEPHIGKVYELTGPQSLTMTQIAQEFSGALGRTIRYINVPPQIWEAKLREAQLPEHLIAHLITMAQLHRDNRYDRMTDSFQQLVGRAPIAAAEFARRHAATFTALTEYQFHWWGTGTKPTPAQSVRLRAESHLHGAALALQHFMQLGCDIAAPLAHLDIIEPDGAKQTVLVEEVLDWLSDPKQQEFIRGEGLAVLIH